MCLIKINAMSTNPKSPMSTYTTFTSLLNGMSIPTTIPTAARMIVSIVNFLVLSSANLDTVVQRRGTAVV